MKTTKKTLKKTPKLDIDKLFDLDNLDDIKRDDIKSRIVGIRRQTVTRRQSQIKELLTFKTSLSLNELIVGLYRYFSSEATRSQLQADLAKLDYHNEIIITRGKGKGYATTYKLSKLAKESKS